MTRRTFGAALAGAVIAGGDYPQAAARMNYPHVFVERRTYNGNSGLQQTVEELFARNGITIIRADGGLRFLFGFDSLHQRALAWDRLNGDPDWVLIRRNVRLTEIKIFRAS